MRTPEQVADFIRQAQFKGRLNMPIRETIELAVRSDRAEIADEVSNILKSYNGIDALKHLTLLIEELRRS